MDKIFQSVVAVSGVITSFLFGGWPLLLNIFLTFVVIDYITGLIASGIQGQLNSKVGWKGIARKVVMFLIIAVAHMVDILLEIQTDMIRNAVIFFYLANELLSIIENAGRIGIPIPRILLNAVEALKGRVRNK
mgnify:FL=1